MKASQKTKSFFIEGREILATSKTQARTIYQDQVRAAFAALDRSPQIITIKLSDGDHTLIITPGLDATHITTIHPESPHAITRKPNTTLNTTKHSTPTVNFINNLYQSITNDHLPAASVSIDTFMFVLKRDLTSLRSQAIQALRDTGYGYNTEENAVQTMEDSAIIDALTQHNLDQIGLNIHTATISQISEQNTKAKQQYSDFKVRDSSEQVIELT